ncbi:MAG: hypothetical protein M1825_000439 [Sarcosagium campestre]|nr:MAG: hypothetical protein M1825_000439 [Sarcosagium campestre]
MSMASILANSTVARSPSSRIFVRGLPPSLTEDEFRKHFSQSCPVTDAKLISHRRIGYVGYKSASEAEAAVKYFNRSFVRMSKINVELARPYLHGTTSSVSQSPVNGSETRESAETSRKRKRDDTSKGPEDGRLHEFLDAMRAPSKSKTWTDDQITPVLEDTTTLSAAKDINTAEVNVDSERLLSLEATKRPLRPNTDAIQETEQESSGIVDSNSSLPEKSESKNSIIEAIREPTINLSDADWLRSRTSRTLELLAQEGQESRLDSIHPSEPPSQIISREEKPADTESTTLQKQQLLEHETAEPGDAIVESIKKSRRLFIRNVPFTTTKEDVEGYFAVFGSLAEVHVPTTSTGEGKGFVYVLYDSADSAIQAYRVADGAVFQGRLLHVLAASPKREDKLDEYALSKLPVHKQRQAKKKAEATSATFSWNSLYMSADAVMSSASERLGISKSELLDPTSADAAVKQAHAETHVIQETKAYFMSKGIDLDSFKRSERGEHSILVKNFPYGTKVEELKTLFGEYGEVSQVLMPPSGMIAIVTFLYGPQARAAFSAVAYRKFQGSVLFLERAPKDLYVGDQAKTTAFDNSHAAIEPKPATSELKYDAVEEEPLHSATLFIKNLSFNTTSQRLSEVLQPLDGFKSARVKTKTDPKRPGQVLSMGFGFAEFLTTAHAEGALSAMQNYNLDGHKLLLRSSHKGLDSAEARKIDDNAKNNAARKTKIIIKNLPFEASKKDVRSLFGAYGQLRTVRLPKKVDQSTRGFAFADFVTAREAANAMESLKNTHLLGRKLILEFALGEASNAEEEIEKMQAKIGRQTDRIAARKLLGGGRKRFNVQDNEFDGQNDGAIV